MVYNRESGAFALSQKSIPNQEEIIMKKIIALLLALSFVLCMAACGAKNEGEELTSDVITVAESTEESTEAPEATEAPEESTEAPAGETTTAEETTAEETTEAAKKPETKVTEVQQLTTSLMM